MSSLKCLGHPCGARFDADARYFPSTSGYSLGQVPLDNFPTLKYPGTYPHRTLFFCMLTCRTLHRNPHPRTAQYFKYSARLSGHFVYRQTDGQTQIASLQFAFQIELRLYVVQISHVAFLNTWTHRTPKEDQRRGLPFPILGRTWVGFRLEGEGARMPA